MSQKLRLVSLSLVLLTASHFAGVPLFAKPSQPPTANANASGFRMVIPNKTETHDLKRLLRNRVIYNRRPNLAAQSTPPKSRTVKIYLWDAESDKPDIQLVPVTRRIGGDNVLKLTMDWLFGTTVSKEEDDRGLTSPTFGMRLEGVSLKKGVALIKFSQPEGETNYGSDGPLIFARAIELTARQFPTVKKVRICAIGDTLIDAQLEKQFPRCAK